MSRSRPGLALLACLASCHATAPARMAASPPAPRPVAPPAMDVAVLPAGQSSVVGVERDGGLDMVLGPARAVFDDGDATFAHEWFTTPVEVAVRGARGWVFVTSDGATYVSETFLGAPQRAGDFPGFARSVWARRRPSEWSRGRAALVDRDGAVWTTDGGGPFARAGRSPGSQARAVAFLDERHGAMIIEGGLVYVTDSAGERWRYLPEADGSFDVDFVAGALGIERVGRPVWLGADLALATDRPRFFDAVEIAGERLTEASDNRLRWALREVNPLFTPAILHVPMPGGALFADAGRGAVLLDRATGQVRRSTRARVPLGADVRAWGSGFVFRMPGPHGSSELMYLAAPGATPHSFPLYTLRGVALSNDGRHAAEACGTPRGAGLAAVCAVGSPEQEPREFALAHPVDGLLAMVNATALARLTPADGGPAAPAWFDAVEGTLAPAAVVGPAGPVANLDVVYGSATSGGGIAALLREHGGRATWVAVGTAGDELSAQRAPDDATGGVAFADAARGVAWGEGLDAIWFTTDGGAHWSPLAIPVDGRASAATVVPPPWPPEAADRPVGWQGARDDSYCDDAGCVIANHVVTRGWGSPRYAGATLLAARAPEPTDASEPGWLSAARFAHYRCTPGAASTRTALPERAGRGVRVVTATNGSIDARFEVRALPRDRAHYRARWRWVDAAGEFAGASEGTLGTGGDRSFVADLLRGREMFVSMPGRDALLVSTCEDPRWPCESWALRRAGPPEAIARAPGFVDGRDSWHAEHGWVGRRAQEDPSSPGSVFVFDPVLREQAYGVYFQLRDEIAPGQYLAEFHGRAGALLTPKRPGDPLWLLPAGGGAELVRLPWEPGERVAACAAEGGAETARLALVGADDPQLDGVVISPREPAYSAQRVVLESTAGAGVCVRELYRVGGGHTVALRAGAGGVLQGFEATATTLRRLRCEEAAP